MAEKKEKTSPKKAGDKFSKKEVAIALEPSNLMLIALEPTEERKKLFSEDAVETGICNIFETQDNDHLQDSRRKNPP